MDLGFELFVVSWICICCLGCGTCGLLYGFVLMFLFVWFCVYLCVRLVGIFVLMLIVGCFRLVGYGSRWF